MAREAVWRGGRGRRGVGEGAPRRQAGRPVATTGASDVEQLRKARDESLVRLREAEKEYAYAQSVLSEAIGSGAGGSLNYGYYSAAARVYLDPSSANTTPPNVASLAIATFQREGEALLRWLRGQPSTTQYTDSEVIVPDPDSSSLPEAAELKRKLGLLSLDSRAVWQREHSRQQVSAPLPTKLAYRLLCWLLDVVFDSRPIPRLWALEVIARAPYLAYVSCIHLYESLGWWRLSTRVRKTHVAEEFNETTHSLICEALGGNQRWSDRFLAQHTVVFYYWILTALFFISPVWSYNASELIEAHAVDTYSQFIEENEELLKELPPPAVAMRYYLEPDVYFDEMQHEAPKRNRRPNCDNLYDVFVNIRDDEREHVKTMHACQRGFKPILSLQTKWFGYAAAFGSVVAALYVAVRTPA